MKLFKTKYRIVTDNVFGYALEKSLFGLFWERTGDWTYKTIEDAKAHVDKVRKLKSFKKKFVEHIE